jgi:hypothetical protein
LVNVIDAKFWRESRLAVPNFTSETMKARLFLARKIIFVIFETV